MRTDSPRFHQANTQLAKEPRHVVNIEFPTASIYCTSHADISGVPGVVMNGVLQKPIVVSQRIVPDEGRSEIGSASFRLVDLGSAFTDDIRSKLAAGNGLRRRRVRFYRGYAGFAWADMQLYQTQIVRDAAFEAGAYQVECNDVTREQRKDVFVVAQTTITANVAPTDTTINVHSTAAFNLVVHDAGYTDAPSSTVGYIKIKDEVIRWTDKTSTTLTGCIRAVFGTRAAAYTVDAATAQDRREKVSEYIYLEGPIPKILYAIQTGILHGDSANLPATWHLGIDPTLIRLTDYTAIGPDLWVPGTPTLGVPCRFEGLTKTDGKRFIESELLTLIGCFQPVYADGALGLKRATRIFRDAAPIFELNETNSVQVGALRHDMSSLHNDFRIHWNWNGERFTRTNILIDQTSINVHGRAPLRELSFKGLHGARHTDGFILKLVDGQRDRFAGPPERMNVDVLHLLNRAEVGDVVRARYSTVRDYAGAAGPMDRAFEIQQFVDDGERLSFELFGSTAAPSVQSPTGAATALPDAWYTSQGTQLAAAGVTIVGDVVQPGTYNLTGNADLNATGAIYYYAGNLTIANGATINITGNIQLRIRGFLQINGAISGQGGGLAGVVDSGASLLVDIVAGGVRPAIFNTIAGNPGYVGGSRGMDGVQVKIFGAARRTHAEHTVPCATVIGKNPTAPVLELAVVSGALVGLPPDLRGSGGAPGGRAVEAHDPQGSPVITNAALGGSGANGGAGLAITCRGMAFGASGAIDLDGNDSAPTSQVTVSDFGGNVIGFAGAGGAGAPGTMYVLLDGGGLSVPGIGTNNFFARTGTVPINGNPLPKRAFNDAIPPIFDAIQPVAGFLDEALISNLDLFNSCQRVQYVPAAETANPDVDSKPPAPTNISVAAGPGFIEVTVSQPLNLAAGVHTRLYSSITDNRPDAVLVGEGQQRVFQPASAAGQTRYFWAQNVVTETGLLSDFFPATLTSAFSAAAGAGPPGAPGADGDDGLSIAELAIYRRSTSAPGTPTGGSYDFGAQSLTPPTNWSSGVPGGNDPVWTSRSVASVVGQTGVDNVLVWSSPVLVLAEGESVDIVFRRAATQPATPAPSGGTPTDWFSDVNSVPGGTGVIWSSVGTRANAGQNWTWQTPVQIEGALNWTPILSSGMSRTGLTFTKASGTTAWDSAFHSQEGYEGCFVTFRPSQNNMGVMVGLNTDPAADHNYISLDFAWYPNGAGTLQIYESGTLISSHGAYSANEDLTILYDRVRVSYYRGTTLIRSVVRIGARLFVDSSFFTVGAAINSVSFGPMGPAGLTSGNLLRLDPWTAGALTAAVGNFTLNQSTSGENAIINGTGPHGATQLLWECQCVDPGTGTGGEANGGWNNTGDLNQLIDATKTYRSTVWVRVRGAVGANGFYHGCGTASDTYDLGGSANSNPYFNNALVHSANFVLDKWYLSVGIIHGSGYAGGQSGLSGIWDPDSGRRIIAGTDFRMAPGARTQNHRAFMFYGGNTTTRQDLVDPRFEVMDGTEPTLASLLVPPDAANPDKRKLVADPDFEFATDDTHWRLFLNGAGTTTHSIAATGGVSGGVYEVVLGNIGANLVNRRRPQNARVVTGEHVKVILRWRRTTSVSGTGARIVISCGLTSNAETGPAGITDLTVAYIVSATSGLLGVGANAAVTIPTGVVSGATVNEWQESEFVCRLANQPKNTTQRPYFGLIVQIGDSASNSGTIKVDAVHAHLVPSLSASFTESPISNQTASFTAGSAFSDVSVDAVHASTTINVTLPNDSSDPMPVGKAVAVYRGGAAAVTFVAGSGVTIQSKGGTSITLQGGIGVAERRGGNIYKLVGDV